ncbi:MAG TPA: PspC domain-containing protein [Kouleothrix sp.]|nr:PspC domain-containing protein [Kouleothrix sp.]
MYNPTQRLMRSRTDKVLAGVAGGIGQYLAIDPVIVRLAFVAMALTGIGVFLYPVLWLIMPMEGSQPSTPGQVLNEVRQQAQRVGDEVREVFVSSRRVRYDPMTGEPIDPETEIPINNVGNTAGSSTAAPEDRRNRLLGMILLGVGAFILLGMVPGFGRMLMPLVLIGAGIMVLRRK